MVALAGLAVAASDPPPSAVRLDVVVTNLRGAPIVDLRPADFELKEDGVVRPITSVELRAGGARVFAFVLDEFHVAAGAPSERVRQSLASFVATRVGPGDLAVAVKPLDPVIGVQFTRDRDSLLAAIASFDGRKGDLAPRSTFEQQFIGHAPAAVETARTQIVSAALRELSLRLGELGADRGVIVLVSEGFARAPAVRQTRVPDLQGVVRAASRFHLAVYSYNPADRDPASPLTSDQSTLEWLAKETGGRAAHDGAAFDSGLANMASDLDSYYALTYAPAQSDGRFHAIDLVARRKNAEVRARPGYWASFSSEVRALIDPPTAPVSRRALRRSTAVNIWTGVTLGPDGRTRLTVTWEPRGAQRAARIAIKAATPDGRALFEGTLSPVGSDGAASPKLATFDVPPGNVQLDMNVQSMAGATIDTDTRDIQVPDLAAGGKGPVMLTPEVIRGRTAPEFRALSADPLAAPTPSRDFTRGDRLLINVPVWSVGGAPVKVTATVTNAIGGAMRTVDRDDNPTDTTARFELPLAWLAPGNYQIVFTAKNDSGEALQAVRFSVR
jgi:VWFA-related protein